MTGTEWKTLAGYGALALAVSMFDRQAALWLVALVGIVAVFRHPDAISAIFGGINTATGGNGR